MNFVFLNMIRLPPPPSSSLHTRLAKCGPILQTISFTFATQLMCCWWGSLTGVPRGVPPAAEGVPRVEGAQQEAAHGRPGGGEPTRAAGRAGGGQQAVAEATRLAGAVGRPALLPHPVRQAERRQWRRGGVGRRQEGPLVRVNWNELDLKAHEEMELAFN